MTKNTKIILWDIETTPIKAYTWTLYPKYLSKDDIIEDWSIICAAWKTLGSNTTKAVSIKTVGDDYEVVKQLRDELKDADIIIGHNADKFDLKKLNTRLIYHKLPPLPKIPTIDTLKIARRIFAFSSNRLDYLAKFLVGEGKIKTEYQLWLDVMKGSKKALREMVAYNKVDVIRLEQVYERLKPYMPEHPHTGAMSGKDRLGSCPKCGSEKFKLNGLRYTATGLVRQECQCSKCKGYFRIPVQK